MRGTHPKQLTNRHRQMVEIVAQGRISRSITHREMRDGMTVWSTNVEERAAEIRIELPNGYVNLEGLMPSVMEGFSDTTLEGYADFPEGFECIPETWEVHVWGSVAEWTKAAETYVTERPNMSVSEALTLFGKWPECQESSSLGNAADNARINEIMQESGL